MRDEALLYIDEDKERKDLEKFTNYYFLMDFWMENIEEEKTLASFFKKRGYKSIAIYGMAALGKHLQKQLPKELQPIYTIDHEIIAYKNQKLMMEYNIDILIKSDVIVVTPITEYSAIKERILSLISIDIVSLEEVILSL